MIQNLMYQGKHFKSKSLSLTKEKTTLLEYLAYKRHETDTSQNIQTDGAVVG